MVNVKTLSFGPTLTSFRRLRYRFYHFFLPRGLALRMEMWELHRIYDRLLRNAAPGEDGDLFNEAAAEEHDLNEQITIHYSNKLVSKARRLFVPVPGIRGGEKDPNWTKADLSDHYYLKPEGMQSLLTAVRAEQRQRREAAAFWLGTVGGTIIGIIGALTGLVALLKK